MATKESDSARQVRQMVNFIMQEAQEKVNELRMKVRTNRLFEQHFFAHKFCSDGSRFQLGKAATGS